MNCSSNKLDLCRLEQNSYSSPRLVFDSDITGDSFVLNIYSNFSRKSERIINGQITEEGVIFSEFTLAKNTYQYEIIRTHNNNDKLVLFGKYIVTDQSSSCGCGNSDSINFTIDDGDTVINFSYSEVILNEGGGSSGADGKSAYEIAVENGFVGTEQEWLESLKGEKGERGEKGETGSIGPQGIKGDTGNQGIQGIQGIKGDKGDKGDTGSTGLPGTTSWTGITDKPSTFDPPVATSTTLGGVKVWFGTQTAYDAIVTKATDVLYFIEG